MEMSLPVSTTFFYKTLQEKDCAQHSEKTTY